MPKFTTPQLSWLTTLGKEADIVLASRVRLARNLKNLPFPNSIIFFIIHALPLFIFTIIIYKRNII